jgi:hypothetical protein
MTGLKKLKEQMTDKYTTEIITEVANTDTQ